MNYLDWIVLIATLAFIVGYGTWKTRHHSGMESYLKGDNQLSWLTIGLSVMATQASAITFISTPGLAFEKGMSFVQNYFGLPFALIIVSAFFIPIYYRLKVFTAYEYLEQRFDLKVRLLTAGLFLLQRGLAAGITIYAPAIILSTTLGWDLTTTILAVGALVIIYTTSGGTQAVSVTQKWQMGIIFIGMLGVFIYLLIQLSGTASLHEGFKIAGFFGKMEVVNFSFDPSERYTFWTGITGGLFLALSYFGTDQSQVQRYLGGKSVNQSRLGLMFNALLKIPMQFLILLTGVLVFLFFQFNDAPLLYNQTAQNKLASSGYMSEYQTILEKHESLQVEKQELYHSYFTYKAKKETLERLEVLNQAQQNNRESAQILHEKATTDGKAKETDYVFLYFILHYLPHGVIGLLLCVILSAAMSSTSGEINALAATTMVDFLKRLGLKEKSESQHLLYSKLLTLAWGLMAIAFALFANLVENLIEAVNILGSLFYGTILGVFIVGFFLKFIRASEVFLAACLAQGAVIILYFIYREEIAYLWFNVISCVLVIAASSIFRLLGMPTAK